MYFKKPVQISILQIWNSYFVIVLVWLKLFYSTRKKEQFKSRKHNLAHDLRNYSLWVVDLHIGGEAMLEQDSLLSTPGSKDLEKIRSIG